VKTNSGYDIIDNTAKINGDSTFYLLLSTVQGCSYSDSVTVKVKNTTNIIDAEIDNRINIYPNPNKGYFRIIISDGNGRYSYEIVDITGKKTADGIVECTTDECIFDISLSNAKPGTYTLIIVKNRALLGQKRFIISQ
jgi:hypothetical protein